MKLKGLMEIIGSEEVVLVRFVVVVEVVVVINEYRGFKCSCCD